MIKRYQITYVTTTITDATIKKIISVDSDYIAALAERGRFRYVEL